MEGARLKLLTRRVRSRHTCSAAANQGRLNIGLWPAYGRRYSHHAIASCPINETHESTIPLGHSLFRFKADCTQQEQGSNTPTRLAQTKQTIIRSIAANKACTCMYLCIHTCSTVKHCGLVESTMMSANFCPPPSLGFNTIIAALQYSLNSENALPATDRPQLACDGVRQPSHVNLGALRANNEAFHGVASDNILLRLYKRL